LTYQQLSCFQGLTDKQRRLYMVYERRSPEEERQRSTTRARIKLRDAIMCLGADRILTCTTRRCITDPVEFNLYLAKFIRRMPSLVPGWKCVAALELQERGAIHAHLAVRGFQNIAKARLLWAKIIGEEPAGQLDLSNPFDCVEHAFYIVKYVGKDLGEFERPRYGHHYKRCRGLKPIVEEVVLTSMNVVEVERQCQLLIENHGYKVRSSFREVTSHPYWLRRGSFRCCR